MMMMVLNLLLLNNFQLVVVTMAISLWTILVVQNMGILIVIRSQEMLILFSTPSRCLILPKLLLKEKYRVFGEIGKGVRFLCDESNEGDCLDGWPSKFNRVYLDKNVQTLERQLSEAENILKEKEMKIVALEATTKDLESVDVIQVAPLSCRTKDARMLKLSLIASLSKKIEAEVVYLTMTTSARDLSALVKLQIKLLEDRKSLAREQASSMRLLTDRDNKDVMLRGQTEQLKTLQQVVEGGGKNLKMRKGIANHAKCFLVQLIFLVLAFVLFVSRLIPKSMEVVPT